MVTINSSSSLFHFTDSADKLIGILKNEFRLNFCLEKIVLADEAFIEAVYPMVCFCDLPLSQIKNHIETYGHYGIGLSKKWAERKGLNPVLYLKQSSLLSDYLNSINQNVRELTKFQQLFDPEEMKDSMKSFKKKLDIYAPSLLSHFAFLEAFKYVKNYEGEVISKKNKDTKIVTFYNEREWRYVKEVNLADLGEKLQTHQPYPKLQLNKEEYEDPTTRAEANVMIENERLSFEPTDIKYVIVKEENEISSMITALKTIKAKYPFEVVEILTSRIITSEQIRDDF